MLNHDLRPQHRINEALQTKLQVAFGETQLLLELACDDSDYLNTELKARADMRTVQIIALRCLLHSFQPIT